tara:strand:+ start:152 stop:355 length:204 start_codon:yes stop_codon:yes gene_type:complete
MLKYIFIGIGFMLLIEGLMYFFFTKQMKNMMKSIENLNSDKIKICATISCIIGVCLIYFTFKKYKMD